MQNIIKEPIYRGCNNRECFCTGKCKEIVGYKERPMNFIEILQSKKFSNDESLINE